MGIILLVLGTNLYGQTPEQEEFIKLYKENYLEWISSPEIARLQARDPELRKLIEQVPVSQTDAYRDALERTNRGMDGSFDIVSVLAKEGLDVPLELLAELLSVENTQLVYNLYWDVIRSARTREIVELILPHVQRAREEFETAGVAIGNNFRD